MVVSNHSSYLDAILLFATLPADLNFVAKRELGEYPLVGPLLRAFGTRFVERDDTERSVRDSRELSLLAGRGESLVFFPEGTFTRAPGLLPFRMGAFVIGAAAGKWPLPPVPAQTLVIHGELDETIPLADVFAWARPQELPIIVLPGADHFFHRRLSTLKRLIVSHLQEQRFDAAVQSD